MKHLLLLIALCIFAILATNATFEFLNSNWSIALYIIAAVLTTLSIFINFKNSKE